MEKKNHRRQQSGTRLFVNGTTGCQRLYPSAGPRRNLPTTTTTTMERPSGATPGRFERERRDDGSPDRCCVSVRRRRGSRGGRVGYGSAADSRAPNSSRRIGCWIAGGREFFFLAKARGGYELRRPACGWQREQGTEARSVRPRRDSCGVGDAELDIRSSLVGRAGLAILIWSD
jgi:hypothetical protein